MKLGKKNTRMKNPLSERHRRPYFLYLVKDIQKYIRHKNILVTQAQWTQATHRIS